MLRMLLGYCVGIGIFLFCSIQAAYAVDPAFFQRKDFQTFIQSMVKKHHFKKQELITLFAGVKLRPQVIQSMNKPLEKEAWHTYQMLFVNEWRIEHGVKFWNEHADALRKAEETYGVPAGIIVATIGVETKYGQKMGEYRVIDSLSSLGFSDSSRAAYFRKELEDFLIFTHDENLDPYKIMGSYAGAFGQPQFMPSSYRYYAVNFSKNGKKDIIHNATDVIGSVANYYQKHGWQPKEPVAVQAVVIGNDYNYLLEGNNIYRPYTLPQLMKYGIAPKTPTPSEGLRMKIIELESRYRKEYWLVFRNFYVIKRYNASNLYAMAVYQLSQYITALKERLNNG